MTQQALHSWYARWKARLGTSFSAGAAQRAFSFSPPKAVAAAVLVLYAFLVAASVLALRTPTPLNVTLGLCNGKPCVTHVAPGGGGWFYGARTGMEVLQVNGQPLPENPKDWPTTPSIFQVTARDSQGHSISVTVPKDAFEQPSVSISLWLLGAGFVLLGAAVLLRRADLPSAKTFTFFAAATAFALAVGPGASANVPWARIAQVITLLLVGFSSLAFALSLVVSQTFKGWPKALLTGFALAGIAIGASYALSLYWKPDIYNIVRSVLSLYTAVGLLNSIALLFIGTLTHPAPEARQQMRVVLAGLALGSLPFVVLTLLPETMLGNFMIAPQFTILGWGLIPAFTAYAILHFHMLGIRKLLHKGIVYFLTSALVLTAVTIAFALWSSRGQGSTSSLDAGFLAISLLVGIVLFFVAERGARWVVDHFVYRDTTDYRTFLRTLHTNMTESGDPKDIGTLAANGFCQALRLESALVFCGPRPSECVPLAGDGPRNTWVLQEICPKLPLPESPPEDANSLVLQVQGEEFLTAHLKTGTAYWGYVVLGPKEGGETFQPEERQLVDTVAPLIALALDKTNLAEELRWLNGRLVNAEETERGRIARDIHDGPLQRAIILAGQSGPSRYDQAEQARELVAELREVCSRLRPAILDDLGLAPSIEWFLARLAKQGGFSVHFSVEGIEEGERLPADVETALFRIAQESTNNAVKHSRGDTITVVLSRNDDGLVLIVSDNGRGFDAKPKVGYAGFGLPGMRERTAQLNGSLDITSSPNSGTVLVARIPLSKLRKKGSPEGQSPFGGGLGVSPQIQILPPS